MKLLKRGAEADIYLSDAGGTEQILKIRRPKPYRNPLLDARLCRQRTIREAQAIALVKSFGVQSPLVHFVDIKSYTIAMQKMPGRPVHDLPESKIVGVSGEIGRLVGLMHRNGLMHGDLTTSNFLHFRGMTCVLDFGLSQRTSKPEDHAVDLRLIKEILNSAHAGIMEPAWRNFLSGYGRSAGAAYRERVSGLVSVIEGRGRYARVV